MVHLMKFRKQSVVHAKQLQHMGRKLVSIQIFIFFELDFYLSLGAVPLSEWKVLRVTGQTLTDLAKGR